jgi:hypothetical protein
MSPSIFAFLGSSEVREWHTSDPGIRDRFPSRLHNSKSKSPFENEGRGSVVSIATRCGLNGPGIESPCG